MSVKCVIVDYWNMDFTEVSKYWAWWDVEEESFVPGMIWTHEGLVEMCFPHGTAHLVKEGKGEKVNVFVERCSETRP